MNSTKMNATLLDWIRFARIAQKVTVTPTNYIVAQAANPPPKADAICIASDTKNRPTLFEHRLSSRRLSLSI
jgi:hypothetical protein